MIRLIGAVLAEQHDEWTEQRRYLGLEILKKCREAITPTQQEEPTTMTTLTAITN